VCIVGFTGDSEGGTMIFLFVLRFFVGLYYVDLIHTLFGFGSAELTFGVWQFAACFSLIDFTTIHWFNPEMVVEALGSCAQEVKIRLLKLLGKCKEYQINLHLYQTTNWDSNIHLCLASLLRLEIYN
jgi:hypothetical protein